MQNSNDILREENIKRLKKRIEAGDVEAIFGLGCFYDQGMYGLIQDQDKAMELYHEAGDLGYAAAYHNIGNAYDSGVGVERDEVKANHYYELAAMGGFATARHNLGNAEFLTGNWDYKTLHDFSRGGTERICEGHPANVYEWTCNKRRLCKCFTSLSRELGRS